MKLRDSPSGGIIAVFEFDPEVLAGVLVYYYENAAEVLRFYHEFMGDAPNEIQCYAVFGKGSPELGLPEPLGDPLADTVEPMPYTALQQILDERNSEGHRNYWKSHNFSELTEGAIEIMVEYCDSMAPFFSVFIEWMDERSVAPTLMRQPTRIAINNFR